MTLQKEGGPAVIRTVGLTKRYGTAAALQDCSLEVREGEVFGLLGLNGAGKTTLLRLLLGFMRPTAGSATVAGYDCHTQSLEVRRRVAYLPGEVRLFRSMRGREVLEFFARLRGEAPERAVRFADRLDLDLAVRVAAMSTGMRQKLALASTFAATTPVVILDEPTSNLDPSARAVVMELVREARFAGRTVVFSSHVLPEVEEACDRVAIVRSGRLVHTQVLADLHGKHRIRARLSGSLPPVPPALQATVSLDHTSDHEVCIETAGPLADVLGWLATLPLGEVRIDPLGLRSVYDAFHANYRSNEESCGVMQADGATCGE